ncbi:hypothetical protein WG899_20990 [Paucibacter sp. AS339]|uniref:type IV pilus assembly protein FimV n=1 Tax=Paucibacter hankyongi TaxID=3133434 RepID=UPI003096DF2E
MRTTCVGALLLCGLALGLTDSAQALGLGRPQMRTALGQALNLEFPLSLSAGESLSADCVTAEVTAGTSRLPAAAVRVQLQGASDSSVRAIRVLSSVKIEEPIISVTLNLGCPTRLTRQYSALLDPPNAQGQHAGSDIEELPQQAMPPRYSPALRAALATTGAKPQDLLGADVTDAGASERLSSGPALAAAAKSSKPAKPSKSKKPAELGAETANLATAPKELGAVEAAPVRKTGAEPHAQAQVGKSAGSGKAAAAAERPAPLDSPKLRLEPLDSVVSAATAAHVAASAAEAEAALQRLNALEAGLGKLREDKRLSEQKLKDMRAQVAAEASGDGASSGVDPLVLGLGLLSLGLGGACAYLWQARKRGQQGHGASWWAAAGAAHDDFEPAERTASESSAASALGLGSLTTVTPQPEDVMPQRGVATADVAAAATVAVSAASTDLGALGRDDERTISLAKLSDVDHALDFARPNAADLDLSSKFGLLPQEESPAHSDAARMAGLFGHDAAAEPLSVQFLDAAPQAEFAPVTGLGGLGAAAPIKGLVSVEALIDLEQQADFFLVLGQEEAAVDLLQDRIKSGIDSALPYLKLMEICQQRGDALAFADIAGRYALRFDASAPNWDQDLSQGRDLEAYADVLREIQGRWVDSGASMSLLQKLLSNQAARGVSLELPALRDLLLLYSVARDRSEHEVRGQEIDLFLPLESEQSSQTGFGMMATMVWQAAPAADAGSTAPVDVDIVLDELPPPKS